MKYFRMNYRSVVSKLFMLLTFIALGCSQRQCSCRRMETFSQMIVVSDNLGEKPTDKFPADVVGLLYLKYFDTIAPGYSPSGNLTRLDIDAEIEDIQKMGLKAVQKTLRSVFPLPVDQVNSGIDSLFAKNQIGTGFSVKSVKSDSARTLLLNQYILKKLNDKKKSIFYFYSNKSNASNYRCKLETTDTTKAKESPGQGASNAKPKKKGKGMGCTDGGVTKKTRVELTRVDTSFIVFHNIDSLNVKIARDADSINKSKSGCSVRDKTVTFIVFYNPPLTDDKIDPDSMRIKGDTAPPVVKVVPPVEKTKPQTKKTVPAATTLPASQCRFKLSNTRGLIMFEKGNSAASAAVTLSTSPNSADSLVWDYTGCSDGLTVVLPGNARHGKKVIPSFRVTKTDAVASGTITFKVTPYKAKCSPAPSSGVYTFDIRQAAVKMDIPRDTTAVNQKRRKIISEFKERLYFYFNAKTKEDQDFYKKDAVKKLNEIPNVKIEVAPQNSIDVIFDTNWERAKIVPLYDAKKYYVVGIRIAR